MALRSIYGSGVSLTLAHPDHLLARGAENPGCSTMSGFDKDFVASYSVLLPDPPDPQRGDEMPLESLGKNSPGPFIIVLSSCHNSCS